MLRCRCNCTVPLPPPISNSGIVRTKGQTSVAAVERAARSFVSRYSTLEPTSGKKAVYKAVVLLFPDVPLSRASKCIDQVQAR